MVETKKNVSVAKQEQVDNNQSIDKLVDNAQNALKEYMSMSQAQIDAIVKAMTLVGVAEHMRLAKLAVQETGRGVVEDKVIKNLFATEYIYHSIKKTKTVGITEENDAEGYVVISEPVGVVAGVTPVTNPTSTTFFKSLITTKTRNPIIFAFHPSAQKCSVETARIMRDAAIKAGAPQHCIQWITEPSLQATTELIHHAGVALILATGGAGLVKAAYSAGKPALGVGAGNVPCYINQSVDLGRACTDLMISKTFDNGMICASEQSVIVDKVIAKDFEKYMQDNNCHFLTEDETAKLVAFLVDAKGGINAKAVGQTADWIAKQSGITVKPKTKILLSKTKEPSAKYPLCFETLMPVLAYFVVEGENQGFDYAQKILDLGGLGHSAVIHSDNKELCNRYGIACKVGRVIVNSPSSQGAIGDVYNTNTPSLTLGCGSYGKNSTTSNVSSVNLLNQKRVAYRRTNMQWFKIPPRMYFENGAIQYLEKMPNIKRAFIVTDPSILQLGYVDKALYYLRKRPDRVHAEIFSSVEPDPSVETIQAGVAAMRSFAPDVIIAIGGGSAIDAAKGMWLFYENPETDFEGLKLKFMDIRKRAFAYPNCGKKAEFVAVPTTSGTGSEVTAFSVITDKKNGNIKYPLADYELTPDVAIIDPQFVSTMPKSIVADTGMDVLTHALEAYVSVLASDYTDGLALKAMELVFANLANSYNNGDQKAREKMHNASAIAGMAFTNAFLGLNHSMAHKLGGEFHIPHGRANALLLPYVIAYNSRKPEKFTVFPKYGEFIADTRYAQIASQLLQATGTNDQKISVLIKAIQDLMTTLNIPKSIKDCGIEETSFLSKLADLSQNAFEDQCTTANPRYPLIADIQELYKQAYYGTPIKL